MMLAIGIAYVALRRHSLYPSQRPGRTAPPAAADGTEMLRAIAATSVAALMIPGELEAFQPDAVLSSVAEAAARARRQRVALVRNASGPCGLVDLQLVGDVPPAERNWMRVGDAMVPLVSLAPSATWGELAERLERCSVSQLPVLGPRGLILGWAGDRELRLALQKSAAGAE